MMLHSGDQWVTVASPWGGGRPAVVMRVHTGGQVVGVEGPLWLFTPEGHTGRDPEKMILSPVTI